VNGVKVASGASTAPIPLAVGANVITVVVTAADGVNTESYSIEVTRASASEFAQQAYLKASSTGLGGQFGYSVALSGDTLAVGVYREDSQARGIDGDSGDDSLSDAGAAYAFQSEAKRRPRGLFGAPAFDGVPLSVPTLYISVPCSRGFRFRWQDACPRAGSCRGAAVAGGFRNGVQGHAKG
jgi:hypothetical protein